MVYLQGEGPERLIDGEEKIGLMTWNLLGLPPLIADVPSWRDRIEKISEHIQKTDADVVIFQECYLKGLAMGIFKRVKQIYPHAYFDFRAERETLLSSGLAVLSKLPISDLQFTRHLNLLDREQKFNLGTLSFVLLGKNKEKIAHIGASHFQGSSRCDWRKGTTCKGKKLNYAEVRQEEAATLLGLPAPPGIPRYIAGDLNVDRRSAEYSSSLLNPKVNPNIKDPLHPGKQLQATSTTYFKHLRRLRFFYPTLSNQEIAALASLIKEQPVREHLSQTPWSSPLANFTPIFFDQLEKKLDLSSEPRKKAWNYVKKTANGAIRFESKLWKKNGNEGEGPPVTIGEVISVRALPIEEALDYILGVNEEALIDEIAIQEGYSESNPAKALSDHHPLFAKIRVAPAKKETP